MKQPITLKRTVKMGHKSKFGLLKDGDKTIYDDSWMHEEDDEAEASFRRMVNAKYTKKVEVEKSESLYLDLEKAINRAKLVQRRVPVKGKNGKIFYRMQWVDPREDMPAMKQSHQQQEEPVKKPHEQVSQIEQQKKPEENVVKKPKEDLVIHEKEVPDKLEATKKKEYDLDTQEGRVEKYVDDLSREEKEHLLNKYNIEWAKNPHPQIDWKNAMVALKKFMHDNPHLAGAEHMPKGGNKTPDGTDSIQGFLNSLSREEQYQLMKEYGITDGIDPETVPAYKKEGGNNTAGIRHLNNMGKLRKYLQDNPHLLQSNPTPKTVEPKPIQPPKEVPKTKAQQGGNTIDGVLKSMSREELYELMKTHGITDVDPLTVAEWGAKDRGGNGTAPIRHMNYMMKLKKLIESDPSILNFSDKDKTILSDTEKKRLEGLGEQEKTIEKVKDFIGRMSRDMKEKLIGQYKDDPTMKSRPRNSNPNKDWMDSVTALRKMFEKNPSLMDNHDKDLKKQELMEMKITNKQIEKVLRRLIGLKGEQVQVRQVEKHKEWEFGLGSFARIEEDDSGNPILSVVDTGDDGTDWKEYTYPLDQVAQFIDDLKGDSEDEASVPEAKETPLHEKNMIEIERAMQQNLNKNYTPEVGERLKPHMAGAWLIVDKSNSISDLCKYTHKMGIGTVADLLRKWGVPISADGRHFDDSSDAWKRVGYGGMIDATKSKNANDYIVKDRNKKTDTWVLHESAKKWAPEERSQARRELIHSAISIEGLDAMWSKPEKIEKMSHLIREATDFIPFDIFTDMMANGLKLNFHKHNEDGTMSRGNHHSARTNAITLQTGYIDDGNLLAVKHPFDHKPRDGKEGYHILSDTIAHEMAHAMDYYLSGGNGYLSWDNNIASKYVGDKHKTCVADSYAKCVEKSNPKHYLGYVDSKTQPFHYHKDEWVSVYEGRIYGNTSDPTGVSHMPVDASGNRYDEGFTPFPVEHWSENVARYANALHAYKRWKEKNVGGDLSMEGWAKKMHQEYKDMGYGTDYEAETGDGSIQSYRGSGYSNLYDNKDIGYGAMFHAMLQAYPTISDGIRHILGRGDFVSDTKRKSKFTLEKDYEKGEYARKSVSDVDLIIEE